MSCPLADRERRSLLRGGGALPSADGTLTHLHGSLIPWVLRARGCGQGRASASRLLLHTQPTARSARGPRQHLQLVSSEGRETCPPVRSPQRAPRFSHSGKAAGLDAPGSARPPCWKVPTPVPAHHSARGLPPLRPGFPSPRGRKRRPPGVPAVITERTGGKCSTWPLTLCFDKFRLLLTVPGRHTAPAPHYREARLPPAPTGPPRAGAPGPEQTPPTAGDKQPRPSPRWPPQRSV